MSLALSSRHGIPKISSLGAALLERLFSRWLTITDLAIDTARPGRFAKTLDNPTLPDLSDTTTENRGAPRPGLQLILLDVIDDRRAPCANAITDTAASAPRVSVISRTDCSKLDIAVSTSYG